MSRWRSASIAFLLAAALPALAQAEVFPGVGRTATQKEIAAWDIDVRPDFKGLPKGSGSVRRGQQVWDGKCASCHGSFGESNEVFAPIIGGTTKQDMETGRVAALTSNRQPQRTTMMKLATLSTLWDYINRAMPWTAPKTLTAEEVYAVTAYILNMAEIVPEDFTLSDSNIGEVQKRMPNRNGMTQAHGLWQTKGRPDVKNAACMKDCQPQADVVSTLPEHARGAHGNLAQQNRNLGGVRGIDTAAAAASASASSAAPQASMKAADGAALSQQHGCVACHGATSRIVGPGFNEIAAKYKDQGGAPAQLAAKVKSGSSGAWGAVPMPAQAHLKDDEIKTMVQWILTGK